MADVLTIVVETPLGRYPTKEGNGRDGFRGGKKSPEFHLLTEDVIRAAQAEMKRVGWQKAEWYCEMTIVRYCSTRREMDAPNLGACEADALEKAGVYENDALAKPWHAYVEYDPGGVDRVLIIVRRCFPRVKEVPANGKQRREARSRPCSATSAARSQSIESSSLEPSTLQPVAYVNGKPILREEALQMIRGTR